MNQSNLAEQIPAAAYAVHPIGEAIPALGAAYGGGFVGAIIPWLNGDQAIVIVADATDGDFGALAWDPDEEAAPDATSFLDGVANSISIDDDSHPAAQKCRAYRGGGFEDWHLLAMAPQDAVKANCCPVWTQLEAFKEGAPQAYKHAAYWSATESQFGPDYAWAQFFGGGYSNYWGKLLTLRARAGRIVLIRN